MRASPVVAAPLRPAPHDELLGWDERTRRHNVARPVPNDRILIRTGVQVRNSASHVLAQALQRLPEDWEERHGTVPAAVETCVGQPHKGTCHQAAGFGQVGETAGYPRGVKRPQQGKQPQEAQPALQSGPAQEGRPGWEEGYLSRKLCMSVGAGGQDWQRSQR